MGTKVQVDSYLPRYCSMRDLNHNSDGTSWASFYGESNLSNGQYYCSPLSRAASDSSPGANKDILKQTILKHESTFKNQVVELHRLYRVQKDLMDEIMRKEQYKHGIPNEASSSNSLLPSQMTPDDAHRRNSSFLFTNSVCDGPPVSIPDIIHSSGGSNLKGKSIRASSSPLQKCGSPKESEVSESRPTKVRRMIDLELLPEEYIDIDEVEQEGNRAAPDYGKNLFPTHCGNTEYQTDACSRKPNALADLNEPVQSEETSADPSVNFFGVPRQDQLVTVPGLPKDLPWKSNMNGTVNNFQSSSKGNGYHWLSSALKEDSGRSIHQTNHLGKPSTPFSPVKSSHQPAGIFPSHPVKEDSWPANANAGLRTFDRTRSFSSYSNGEAALVSQLPSYVHSSDLAHSWDPYWGRPNSCLSQKSSSVQASPYLNSVSLSKSPQSSVWSNEFIGNGWHMSTHPRSNPGFPGESSMQNGFYAGSSCGLKELPAHFGKAAPDYVNGSYSDKANSFDLNSTGDFNLNSTGDFNLNSTGDFNLNSTGDFNLNVALPNDLSSEPLAERGAKIADSELKREDPPNGVLPWLRPKVGTSTSEAASGRRGEVAQKLDHQNSVVSASCDGDALRAKPSSCRKILGVPIFEKLSLREEEIGSGSQKGIFDINVPCEEAEDFDNSANMSESIVREEKEETGRSSVPLNIIDLNSCVTEDEIPSINADSTKLPCRAPIIDLEAPVDLETEEDDSHQVPLASPPQDLTDSTDKECAMEAAEAIVAISSYSADNHVAETGAIPHPVEEATGSEDALAWFVDIACSCPYSTKSCPDDPRNCLSSEPDCFEEMTLNITECTAEEYFPSPPIFDIPTVEETSPTNLSGRTRRGPPRRGRQRRDFQRDILPGLTSLARHEVTEDLQTFGGLMRATGHAWHCGARRNGSRNGSRRGRKKSVVVPLLPAIAPPTVNTIAPYLAKNGEIILESRSLTSWGKTTRRPRRQRCPPAAAGNLAPIALT